MTGDQIEIVGWKYEVYSETLETWRTVTTFTRTAPEIRERARRIRRLTPLVAVDDIIGRSLTRQIDTVTDTDRRKVTTEASDRHTRGVAVARNGYAGDSDEDHD